MPLAPNYRYNSNTFEVEPQSKKYFLEQDTGVFPPSNHSNALVYNVGRTEVFVKLKYGSKFKWHGTIVESTVKPGETKVFDNGGHPYFVTGLKIYNRTNVRAIVHCATDRNTYGPLYSEKEPGTFDDARNKLFKSFVSIGLKYIPEVGPAVATLVSTFWPDGKPNVWEQVHEKVQYVVDKATLDVIGGILSGAIMEYKDKISEFAKKLKQGGDLKNIREFYMNIAQGLVGFEKNFRRYKDTPNYQNVNQYILSYYSTTVLLKVTFYAMGIKQAQQIGLSAEDVNDIRSYTDRTLNDPEGANKYITDLYDDRLDASYRKIFSEDLYDGMMNTRTLFALHGFEYIRIWNYLYKNLTTAGLYNEIISYSNFFGRQTPQLIKEATVEELRQPLTPVLINGKRNKISLVDVYIWRINNGNGPPRIGGMRVEFKNGDSYSMGNISAEYQTIRFNEALLMKLDVYGDGSIDLLTFHFSDGRAETIGESTSGINTVFELVDHHIVSMFLASDCFELVGQAANICVSYQLIEK